MERIWREELAEGGAAGGALTRACNRIEADGRALLGDWLDGCAHEARQVLLRLAAEPIDRLQQLRCSVDAVGREVFGIDAAAPEQPPEAWSDSELPSFLTAAVDWSVAAKVPWSSYGVPVSLTRRGAERRLEAAFTEALDGCRDRLVHTLTAAAEMWMDTLCNQTEIATREAGARFRSTIMSPIDHAELASVEQLETRLLAFASILASQDADQVAGPSPVMQGGQGPGFLPPTADAGCVICRRLEATLADYLRVDQFDLATREERQAAHAEGHGFCPLHTWDYAELASSTGISAAYARLAEAAAHALRAIEARSSTLEDLWRGVAWLLQGPEGCPVCRTLAAAEQSAIAELVGADPEPGRAAPPLCVLHLELCLRSGPGLARGRQLARALSDVLERTSEDMRTYALKRESLRAGLVTDEERRAHLLTLRYLAGHANLVRPWRLVSE